MNLRRPLISWTLLTALAAGTSLAHGADPVPAARARTIVYPFPTAPCTTKESWAFGGKLPLPWIKRFNESLQSSVTAANALPTATALFQQSKDPEMKSFGQYWAGRIAFVTKMPHLAAKLFNQVLTDSTDRTLGVRLGAIECFNILQQKYPTLMVEQTALKNIPASALALPEPQRGYLRDAAIYSTRQKLAAEDAAVDLSTELKLVAGSSVHETIITILKASHDENETDLAALAEKIPETFEAPIRFKDETPLLMLSLARGLYGKGKFQKSIDLYKRVKNSSNLVSTSITERAWASLSQDRTAEAIGTAANLIVGGLKKTFAPEAFAVAIIALTETCNYSQALELIKAFRKTYGAAYKWLYDWRANPNYAQAQMYPLLTAFLKKKSGIPERIGLEWIRSPVFTAYQEELNAVLEQKTAANRVWARALASLKPAERKSMSGPIQGVKQMLGGFTAELPKLENTLLQKINQHLLNRNRSMLTYLADVSENVQRVEVEVFNALGEKLVSDNARGSSSSKVDNSRDGKKPDEGATWDWGRFPTASDEEAEIWEDELGFLRADLKSRCSK